MTTWRPGGSSLMPSAIASSWPRASGRIAVESNSNWIGADKALGGLDSSGAGTVVPASPSSSRIDRVRPRAGASVDRICRTCCGSMRWPSR
jgi:hypothetical protein